MNTFKALVKREFWEHKGSMFITPIVMASFFAILMLIGIVTANNITVNGDNFSLLNKMPQMIEQFSNLSDYEREKGVQIALYAPIVIFGFVMVLISVFYCAGSLYDERKDRSILFWKSLPISDTSTVLSKFVAVTLMIPVFYFIAMFAFQLYSLLFGTVLSWFGGDSGMALWASSNLFVVIINTLLALIISSLWLAPMWAWLMLASAWAKKVSILWGTLPVALIAIAEGTMFQSSHFIEMVGKHIAKGAIVATASISNLENDINEFGLDLSHPIEAFQVADFWIGAVIAAVFLAGAIFIRRHRDEA